MTAGKRREADVVAGEEDEVGRECVHLGDDTTDKTGLSVLVVVDVGDLDDAKVMERIGEFVDEEVAGEDANLVAGDFRGVEREAARRGERGAEQELTAGETLFLLAHRRFGNISRHSP